MVYAASITVSRRSPGKVWGPLILTSWAPVHILGPGLSVKRGRPSVQWAADLGRGFPLEALVSAPAPAGLDPGRAELCNLMGEEGPPTRGSALGRQPSAEEAQTVLPAPLTPGTLWHFIFD